MDNILEARNTGAARPGPQAPDASPAAGRLPEGDTRPPLDDAARQRLLVEFNDTAAAYRHDALIHQLFEERAALHPDAPAVRYQGEVLSYAALDARANRLAHRLVELGIRPGDRVAVCIDRSVALLVGILGALKAGAAYVPLDPSLPAERLAYMLDDCAPGALLVHASTQALALQAKATVAVDDEALASLPALRPAVAALHAQSLAYVIYTSGSTGKPKGVMVEHRSVVNMIEDWRRRFPFAGDAPLVASQWTSVGFDVSVFELFVPLALGGLLHITPAAVRVETNALLDWLRNERISFAYLPPFFIRNLKSLPDAALAGLSLKQVLTGVEALHEDELARLEAVVPGLKVVNAYGPTEATVYCTSYVDIGARQRVAPIGRPLANSAIYILDEDGLPVPVGVPGEIHIGGACLARGYLNRPELTAERFVHDPFSGQANARMYKTGDLGHWLPDGTVACLGRRDAQLKIRGYRIEPGEIEAVLGAHPAVREAVVVARGADEDKRLVAYVTTQGESGVAVAELREHLMRQLPDYMVPAAFVRLAQFPLTSNGKLDRNALPAPDAQAVVRQAYVPPQGDVERALATVWAEVLGIGQIGRYDDFLALGGNSLLVSKAMTRINARFSVDLPLRTLFEVPTLCAVAERIELVLWAMRQPQGKAQTRECRAL